MRRFICIPTPLSLSLFLQVSAAQREGFLHDTSICFLTLHFIVGSPFPLLTIFFFFLVKTRDCKPFYICIYDVGVYVPVHII